MMRNQGTTDSTGSHGAVLGNGESHKNQTKLKDKMCNGGGGGADADSWLASWPPRHYTCNFCRRRFKSAQALGGHMNVHRRARAMLRSQSISPISSPPSSPWLPSSITTSTGQTHHHPRPFQNDEHYFLYPNPNLNYRPSNNPHHMINPANQSNLSYLPTSCSSILTSMHKNPLPAPAFKHMPMPEGGQCHHAQLISNRERAKKNCIRADQNNLNGLCSWRRKIHQDDVVSRLSLGTGLITTRPAMEEDIDLELRL
ncbi:unnamed protein product [Rhodiola kirilowii]